MVELLETGSGVCGKFTTINMLEQGSKLIAMPMAVFIGNITKQKTHSIIRNNIRLGSTPYPDDNLSCAGTHKRHKAVDYSAKRYV